MRKQALIHYHGLVDEIAKYCAEDGMTIDLEAYQSVGTRPTSIHHAKDDHRTAVFALLDGITEAMADEERETVTASAD